ncbi:MAG: RNA polymerase sigma factor [Solirubrobacteraceae bacterium]|nr:RNA polymerase sigma factor [Patulibacter sp.]
MQSHEFVAWYEKEAEAVLVFHARRTLDPELALDLTAETFAQAWRSRGQLQSAVPEVRRAWLFTIARRQIGRYHRKGRVEREARERLQIQTPPAHEDDLAAIDERAGLPELRAAMTAELERLSADHRRALQLRIVEERPYDEIAGLLGVSEQTVRARVSRGLTALSKAAAVNPVLQAER